MKPENVESARYYDKINRLLESSTLTESEILGLLQNLIAARITIMAEQQLLHKLLEAREYGENS